MSRAVNITAYCTECNEVLDTNDATLREVIDEDGILQVELHVGTEHVCWAELKADDPEDED